MAEKNEILSSLNNNVKEINDNVKQFGPKLPAGIDKTKEIQVSQLAVLCAIYGTLIGQDVNENNVASKLKEDKKGIGGGLYANIKETIDGIKEEIKKDNEINQKANEANITKKANSVKSQEGVNNKLLVEIISNTSDLTKLIESLTAFKDPRNPGDFEIFAEVVAAINTLANGVQEFNDINLDKKKIVNNITDIIDAINIINEELNNKDILSISGENIENFKEFVETKLNDLPGIDDSMYDRLEAIKNVIAGGDDKTTSLKDIFSAMNGLENISDSIKNVREMLSTFDVLYELLNKLQQFKIDKKIINGNIASISYIVDAISKIASVKLSDIIHSKFKITLLNHIIDSDLGELLDTLNKKAVESQKSKQESVILLSYFIDAILKLADVSLLQLFRMHRNFSIMANNLTYGFEEIITSLEEISSEVNKSTKIINTVRNFVSVLFQLADFDKKKQSNVVDSFEFMEDIVDNLEKIFNKINNTIALGDISKTMDNFVLFVKYINTIVDSLPSIGILFLATIKTQLLEKLFNGLSTLITLYNKLPVIDNKNFNLLSNSLHELNMLIITCAGMLLFVSVISSFIVLGNIIEFTIMLGALIIGITSIILLNSRDIKDSGPILRGLAELVVSAGIILILAGLLASQKLIVGAALFAVVLGAFIWLTTKAVSVNSDNIKVGLKGMTEFGTFIAICGITLIYGAMLYQFIPWEALVEFATTLGLFVLGMIMALWGSCWLAGKIFGENGSASQILKKVTVGMAEFGILIALSGFTLIFGAMLYKNIDKGSLLGFAAVLFLFILGISFAIQIATKKMKSNMLGISGFGTLVAVCGIVLLLGSILYEELDKGAVWGFMLVLALFVIGIGLALWLAGQGIEKNKWIALEFTLLVLVLGGVLLFAGYMMSEYPNMLDNIWGFVIATLVLTGGVAFILYKLSKTEKDLKKGELALLVVAGAIWVVSKAIKNLAEATSITDMGKLWSATGLLFAILAAVAAGLVGLGYLIGLPPVAAFIGVAIGVLLAAAAAIWVVADALGKVVDSIDKLSKIKKFDAKGLVSSMSAITDITKELAPIIKSAPDILKVSKALSAMVEMLGDMSYVVKQYATLTIPIYKNGLIVGFQKMTPNDFKTAKYRIDQIITTVGKAIVKVVKGNTKVFGAPDSIFGGDVSKAPAVLAAKAIGAMTIPLSMLASVVENYASLKIPIYDEKTGKQKGYRLMSVVDFGRAAAGIYMIITCIGNAITSVVKDNKDIFGAPDSIFGGDASKAPAMIAAKAISQLSIPISTLAYIIGMFAMGQFPLITGYDNNGKPKYVYIPWNPISAKIAQNNITSVFSALINGITAVMQLPNYAQILNGGDVKLKKTTDTCLTFTNELHKIIKQLIEIQKSLGEGTIINDLLSAGDKDGNGKGKLIQLIEGYGNAIAMLITFGKNNDKDIDFWDWLSGKNSTITADIEEFSKNIDSIVNVAQRANNVGEQGFTFLSEGIIKLNDSINGKDGVGGIKQNSEFEDFNDDLDDFSGIVNKINTVKLSKITEFVKSMNILATKLGNLDGLTEAISNKLSEELSKLTKELTNAKNVINKAEEIQKKRQTIIENQVKNVKEILSQSLCIEIKQVNDDNTLTDPTQTGGDSTVTSNPTTTSTSNNTGGSSDYTPIVKNDQTSKESSLETPWSKNKSTQNNKPVKKSGANPGFSESDLLKTMKMALQTTKWKLDKDTNLITYK